MPTALRAPPAKMTAAVTSARSHATMIAAAVRVGSLRSTMYMGRLTSATMPTPTSTSPVTTPWWSICTQRTPMSRASVKSTRTHMAS